MTNVGTSSSNVFFNNEKSIKNSVVNSKPDSSNKTSVSEINFSKKNDSIPAILSKGSALAVIDCFPQMQVPKTDIKKYVADIINSKDEKRSELLINLKDNLRNSSLSDLKAVRDNLGELMAQDRPDDKFLNKILVAVNQEIDARSSAETPVIIDFPPVNITTEPIQIDIPNHEPVSQEEIDWALQLENKVKKGYQPTQAEVDKYQDIASRLSSEKNQNEAVPSRVSQEEIDWALQLEQKIISGYKPTQAEIDKYTEIVTNFKNPGPVPKDIESANSLQLKVSNGYKPTQAEMDKYTEIFNIQNRK